MILDVYFACLVYPCMVCAHNIVVQTNNLPSKRTSLVYSASPCGQVFALRVRFYLAEVWVSVISVPHEGNIPV
jgi:transcription elongation factor Elf1